MLETVLGEQVAVGQGVNGHGPLRIQNDMLGHIFGQELVHLVLLGDLHTLGHMGQVEAVEADIDGQQDILVLSQAISHDHGVQDLLVILHIDLQPAGVTDGQRILRAAPQGLGGDHLTVGNSHDHRQTQGGGPEVGLIHQRQALGGTGGEHAGAGQGSAGDNAHGGQLTLHLADAAVQGAAGHKIRQILHNGGLGCDGIGRNDIGAAHSGADGGGHIAVDYLDLTHYSSSFTGCISMAPFLHSWAQMPQPLQ